VYEIRLLKESGASLSNFRFSENGSWTKVVATWWENSVLYRREKKYGQMSQNVYVLA
jgi:hypothetical protein